jgi:tRNA-2-methylthio-N6-dimethylallyladenosine synthase
MADLDKVCEHVHLPLQSGSNRILTAMKRGYSFEDYVAKIRALRERVPRMAITTDMIVGFPGETEEDFRQTLAALDEIRFDQIFSFKFSRRPGTAALRLSRQVSEEVKSDRLTRVHQLQDRITGAYHSDAVNTVEEILVEGVTEKTGQLFGRTRTNKIVNLDLGEYAVSGQLVKVVIMRGLKHSLTGRIVR